MIQHPTIPKGKHGKLLIKINEFLILWCLFASHLPWIGRISLDPSTDLIPNPLLQTWHFRLWPSFLQLCPLLEVDELIKINELLV